MAKRYKKPTESSDSQHKLCIEEKVIIYVKIPKEENDWEMILAFDKMGVIDKLHESKCHEFLWIYCIK